MVRLEIVKNKERKLLYNINQKYLYEMTLYYDDKMDEEGNYNYGYFDLYFKEKERIPYFIYNDNTIIGFIFINNISYFGDKIDYSIAEFTIFPHYRNKGYAKEAVNIVFNLYKGVWEIKYNEKNIKAKNFWNSVTKSYNPKKIKYSKVETVLKFIN